MSLRLNAIIIKDNGVSARGSYRVPSQLAPLYRVPVDSECTWSKCFWSSSSSSVYIRARTKRAPFPALFSTRHVHLCVFRVRIRPGSNELPACPEGAKGYLDISKRLVSAMGCRRNREITKY